MVDITSNSICSKGFPVSDHKFCANGANCYVYTRKQSRHIWIKTTSQPQTSVADTLFGTFLISRG